MMRSSVLGMVGQSLLLGAMLSIASGCARQEPTSLSYPPVEDVRQEAKPVPGAETLESEEAANLFDSALEAWGDRGWAAVRRICEDAVRKGAPYPKDWCLPPR